MNAAVNVKFYYIIVVRAQGSACQCKVLHLIICKLGKSVHWQGRDIKARKGEVKVGGTEEVQELMIWEQHADYNMLSVSMLKQTMTHYVLFQCI